MSYEIEDEIDWSDGPLGPPTPTGPEIAADPDCSDSNPQLNETDPIDSLFFPETFEPYQVPPGSPLPITYDFGRDNSTVPTRLQRAQIGVHLNRRQPTKEDYKNFALYQANQKAYEADVLKKFVTHALHPDRLNECLGFSTGGNGEGIAPYLRSVSQNVRGFANKMIWNAQCRAVNLLANDGTDGIPFLDLERVGQGMFSDFCRDNLVHVSDRMNESWHRAYTQPPMARLSTKQYPIGCHSSPLEEIDETADQVFNNQDFTSKLVSGRAIDVPSKRKGKGRGMPGMASREHFMSSARGSWLSFPATGTSLPPATHEHEPFPMVDHHAGPSTPQQIHDHNIDSSLEPQILQDLRNIQQAEENGYPHLQTPAKDNTEREPHSTRLEELVDLYGAEALNSDRSACEAGERGHDLIEEVPSWRTMLLDDHKRRLTERFPSQTLRRALPGIKQVIADALTMGYRCTDQDLRRKITIIEAKEQSRSQDPPLHPSNAERAQHMTEEPLLLHRVSPKRSAAKTVVTKKRHVDAPKKRQKTISKSSITKKRKTSLKKKTIATPRSIQRAALAQSQLQAEEDDTGSSEPHPSGSLTLESHQVLPPNAYFEPQSQDEQPAWRCGIQHAMGYYYNAGNRSACIGCNTNIKDMKRRIIMDFYLPLSSWSYQAAPPGIVWKPNKPHGKPRASKSHIHNSIAKDAYWPVYNETGDEMLAWQAGIDAVNDFFESRKPKEPTPEPTPEPEPDLGPHPSGSATMEHGQDIPECAYFDKQDEDEVYAYRCDVNHALGRYYLAGDKKSCPGCGTNKTGQGRHTDMDFYMPQGVCVRQDAPGLVVFKPKKYKVKPSKTNAVASKKKYLTHNQICSRNYFEAIDAGHGEEEAMSIAIAQLEAELDAKEADTEDESSVTSSGSSSTCSPKDSATTGQTSGPSTLKRCRSPRSIHPVASTVPAKRYLEVSSDEEEEDEEVLDYAEAKDVEQEEISIHEIIEISSSSSSDDEDTSGSDSE